MLLGIGEKVEYSKSQLKAVSHVNGPMMVLAGPGSGKTAVITGRVKYLIEEAKIAPDSILVITFTKAAANEMKERFIRLAGSSKGVRFSTFHSVFFTILRLSYGYGADKIISEELSKSFIREKLKDVNLENGDEKDFIKNILGEISKVKSENIAIENYYSINCPENAFRDIYVSYGNFMKSRGLIDFDDMMLLCDKLFNERKDVLEAWRNKYKYFMIDEFQDASRLQFELIRKMAEPDNNIFVVGDDDQSIYRFRGAKPEIMLNFPKLYKKCEKVVLDENYRSTEAILEFAGKVITENKSRYSKNIVAANREKGSLPVIRFFEDRKSEDTEIVRDIIKTHEKGIPFSEIAVVYRTNLLSRPIISRFMEYNVPFIMKEAVPDIYDHWIAGNIMDYLELAGGSRQRGRFLRIMNRPNRFLSRESVGESVVNLPDKPDSVSFVKWRDFYKGKNWMIERLSNLQFDLTKMGTLPPFASIHYLRNVVGYDAFLSEYAKERKIDEDELLEVIEELHENSKPFRELESWKRSIEEADKKKKEIKRDKTEMKDAVVISTMHGCKGLEFHKVYVPDVVEGVLPYKKAIRTADIEEERRLFYVALTRAKRELVITAPKTLYGKKRDISPFIGKLVEK